MSESTSPEPNSGQSIDDDRGRIFPCRECGADLVFHIGTQQMQCPYCGDITQIELEADRAVTEQDFTAALQHLAELRTQSSPPSEHNEVRCESCGSSVLFEGALTSTQCPYCGSPIQREKIHRGGFRLAVDGLLPFQCDRETAHGHLSRWVRSRWFAPNDFKKAGTQGDFQGVYLPFWTFDTMTFCEFRGQRGDNYTVTVGSGKNRRRVTRTRWSSASGRFQRFFDDVLICASNGVPERHLEQLAPWPLENCVPFRAEYLAGLFARTYDRELDQGFSVARKQIDDALHGDCRRRIGGDHQRITHFASRCDAVTFKHLLLPVWMFAYRYKEKTYRVLINAVTGEVQGDRPYSWVKITGATLVVLVIAGIIFLMSR